jgi:hypothetical protein
LIQLLTEGQAHEHRGAATVLQALPDTETLIADKGVKARPGPPGPVRSGGHPPRYWAIEPQGPGHLQRQPLQAAQSG